MKNDSVKVPVLLYDGVCGFCNKTVHMILAHDTHGTLRFAALQSNYGRALVARHPILRNVDSLVFIETSPGTDEECVFIRSSAVLRVAMYLGGRWKLLCVLSIIPTPLRDVFYDLFAKYRYKLFGRHDSCMIPPPDARARFLDLGG
ncbi:MAG: DUF393 domain-containing protein [Nitrospinae bacterium]|nr:DUF393 domain-containing protein [Nitrospinota bacterium]